MLISETCYITKIVVNGVEKKIRPPIMLKAGDIIQTIGIDVENPIRKKRKSLKKKKRNKNGSL